MSKQSHNPFKWRHFQSDLILLCVRGYLRDSLSYRDLEEIMRERGLHVDHTRLNLTGDAVPLSRQQRTAFRVDETSIKVTKEWLYLYRAVDSTSARRSISSSAQQEMHNLQNASFSKRLLPLIQQSSS